MDRLLTEQSPAGVWCSGGLESDDVEGRGGLRVDTVTKGGRRFMTAWRK